MPRLLDLLARVTQSEGCWEWGGWHNNLGYGYVRVAGRDRPAHRMMYEAMHGVTLARGIDVDHLCGNPGCVRPLHLEAVPHQVNIKRGRAGTKMACKYGHDWHESRHVYVRKDGRRWCAACARERWS